MSEPLHLKPDAEPEFETVRLGDQSLELDPHSAQTVRDAFESLAAQYGAALESLQRQTLQQVGTPWQGQYQAPQPQYQPPAGLEVPDPDILFQNKGAWTDGLAQSLQGQLGGLRQENLQAVSGLAQAFQQELARRDAAQEARSRHDAAMQEMLDRRGLTKMSRMVQQVYNEQYDKLKHLPLELALDRIGAETEAYIEEVRSGEQWQLGPSNTQAGMAPRPPAMLRSARRASRAPAPTPVAEQQGLQSPGGDIGQMSKIILKYQNQRGARGASV